MKESEIQHTLMMLAHQNLLGELIEDTDKIEVSKTTGWRRVFFWRKKKFKTIKQISEEFKEYIKQHNKFV